MTTTTRRPPTPAASNNDWRAHAACVDADADLFFPTGSSRQIIAQTREAKRICVACPSRTPCLRWALGTRQAFGVWGGLTGGERRDVLRRRTSRTRAAAVEKALKPRWLVMESILGQHGRIVELRKAGWDSHRVAADLGVHALLLVAVERLVAEAGSVEAALGNLAVAA